MQGEQLACGRSMCVPSLYSGEGREAGLQTTDFPLGSCNRYVLLAILHMSTFQGPVEGWCNILAFPLGDQDGPEVPGVCDSSCLLAQTLQPCSHPVICLLYVVLHPGGLLPWLLVWHCGTIRPNRGGAS